ncbi:hypothetical protein O181_119566 [Austropuccinia psidii MF-1]|uniref:Uncharacterized protein n=1 Tax=Austropuccinia psidii MF-1 TaxID=1389203 RepID=A0A9Q3KGR6_9BASI|nr:hypothetical protein [Austropuccinia psidii MF-1]
MVSSHELGIEVKRLAHESNPDPPVLPECEHRFIFNIFSLSKPDTFFIAFISSQPPSYQKPNFKIYENEKTVEPCAPTEDAGQDDVIFSGEVGIISKEKFISKIAQKIPMLKKIQNDSKIHDYVRQKIAEAMSVLKTDLNHRSITNSIQKRQNGCFQYMGRCGGGRISTGRISSGNWIFRKRIRKKTKYTCHQKHHTFEATKDSWDQGDEMINVEAGHIDNQPPHTEIPPYSMKQSMMNLHILKAPL